MYFESIVTNLTQRNKFIDPPCILLFSLFSLILDANFPRNQLFFPVTFKENRHLPIQAKKIEIVLERMNKMFFCVMGVFVIVLMFVLL